MKLQHWIKMVWAAVCGHNIIYTNPAGSGSGESSNGIGVQEVVN